MKHILQINLSFIYKLGFGLLLLTVLFSIASIISSSVSAACDKDATCRNRDGNKPYCRNPGNNGECVQCLNNSHCKSNETCNGGRCVAKPTTPPTAPPTTAPTGTFFCSQNTADVMLVIDASNSMQGGKLSQAKNAANQFVDIVSRNPQNRVGVAHFDNNGGVILGFTSVTNSATIKNKINSLKTPGTGDGGTCLECAIKKDKGGNDVFSAFGNNPSNNKKIVIILTDGKINHYMQPDGDIVGGLNAGEEAKAREHALGAVNSVKGSYGAIFYAVQYGGTSNQAWLRDQIANGPNHYQAEVNGETLEKMYADIANIILGGTIVAFTYDDANKNGKFDTGEPVLPNVTVKLTTAENKVITKNTDAQGMAKFDQLCSAANKLEVTPPDQYEPSPEGSNNRSVTVPPGETKKEDFGFKKKNTPDPGNGPMSFIFKLALHGLGVAGDNVLPRPDACVRNGNSSASACLSNQNPLHPVRDLSVQLINNLNEVVATMSGKLTYSSSSGLFEAKTNLTPGVEEGAYTFSVQTPMYLVKKILFRQTLKPNETYELPETDMTSSDVDNDNALTVLDYNQIVKCYTFVNNPSPCNEEEIKKVDNDDNGVVDEFSINLFLRDISVINGD